MRTRKAMRNAVFGWLFEAISIVCAFIVPRLILTSFGSQYNGITQAATQFLLVINLFSVGISGVARYALYKPLAENDREKLNVVVKTVDVFFKKISFIFLIILAIIACGYPYFVRENFEWLFASTLIFIIGISSFAQYFWGRAYAVVAEADQRQAMIYSVKTVILVFNTILAAVLIKSGCGIHAVKFWGAVFACLNPLLIRFYVKRKYMINPSRVKPDNSLVSQRWDYFGQQVAGFVRENTDLIVISIFLNIYEVSVYTVYVMVIRHIRALIDPFVAGQISAFGNMVAQNEIGTLKKNLGILRLTTTSLSMFLYGVAGFMLVPFVMLYTSGVTDVNYNRPLFAVLVTLSFVIYNIHRPYGTMVLSFGHFKQMRNFCFIEATANIVLSVIFVNVMGLSGVIVGTIAANSMRTIYYSVYSSKKLVPQSLLVVFKESFVQLLVVGGLLLVSYHMPLCVNYLDWVIRAVVVSVVTMVLIVLCVFLFFKQDFLNLYAKLKSTVIKG